MAGGQLHETVGLIGSTKVKACQDASEATLNSFLEKSEPLWYTK